MYSVIDEYVKNNNVIVVTLPESPIIHSTEFIQKHNNMRDIMGTFNKVNKLQLIGGISNKVYMGKR